jgi:hypothetical protein
VWLQATVSVFRNLAVVIAQFDDGHDVQQKVVEAGRGILEVHMPPPKRCHFV